MAGKENRRSGLGTPGADSWLHLSAYIWAGPFTGLSLQSWHFKCLPQRIAERITKEILQGRCPAQYLRRRGHFGVRLLPNVRKGGVFLPRRVSLASSFLQNTAGQATASISSSWTQHRFWKVLHLNPGFIAQQPEINP